MNDQPHPDQDSAVNRNRVKSFRDLTVWKRSNDLVEDIYLLTRHFPDTERFGLISQMRRASVSVPSNIAEGQARHTTGEYIRSVANAEGSLAELETQLRLSKRVGLCNEKEFQKIIPTMNEIRKMLNGLRISLKRRQGKS